MPASRSLRAPPSATLPNSATAPVAASAIERTRRGAHAAERHRERAQRGAPLAERARAREHRREHDRQRQHRRERQRDARHERRRGTLRVQHGGEREQRERGAARARRWSARASALPGTPAGLVDERRAGRERRRSSSGTLEARHVTAHPAERGERDRPRRRDGAAGQRERLRQVAGGLLEDPA